MSRSILGVPVSCFHSYKEATDYIVGTIERREKTLCVAINPEKVCFALTDASFREAISRANIHICDGMGVALAALILRRTYVPRITGIGLFLEVLAVAAERGLSVYLLGARPEVNRKTCEELQEKYTQVKIAGAHDGYFQDDQEIVAQINASNPDMLFVALGSPRQEHWIAKHRAQLHVPFCMGVGGSFDVLSGRVRRAPALFRKSGTEWLYRLVTDPRRLGRQLALPVFVFHVLRGCIHRDAAAESVYAVPSPHESYVCDKGHT